MMRPLLYLVVAGFATASSAFLGGALSSAGSPALLAIAAASLVGITLVVLAGATLLVDHYH